MRPAGRPPPYSALTPVLDEDAADDLEPGAPLPLKDAGPSYAALGTSGYAEDTQAVALGAASLQGRVPATEEWLQVTGQAVCVDNSCPWVKGAPRRCCSEGSQSH